MAEENLSKKIDELMGKTEAVNRGLAVLNESVKYIGQELKTRTDVIFRKLEDHEIRIRHIEGDMKVISRESISSRLRFLETWQAKAIGASAALLLIIDLTIHIWRTLK